MIVLHHYPRPAKRRANVPVDLGDNGYVGRHRRCSDDDHIDVAARQGRLLAWLCRACGRVEVA